jgi:hypothetical protein
MRENAARPSGNGGTAFVTSGAHMAESAVSTAGARPDSAAMRPDGGPSRSDGVATPQTRNDLYLWVHEHLHLPADLEAQLITAIESVFTR